MKSHAKMVWMNHPGRGWTMDVFGETTRLVMLNFDLDMAAQWAPLLFGW